MRIVRVFLSSPGDCSAERQVTHQVAARLNNDPIIANFARIEIIAWDWSQGVPLDAIRSPQASVDAHLSTPEECEVFIGISRCRFGTPLPISEYRKEDGTPFLSGSEYEFDRAWKARRRGLALPAILIYRSNDMSRGKCAVDEQSERTKDFFESPPFKDQEGWTGSVNYFESTDDYCDQVESHFRKVLSQWHPSARLPLTAWLASQAQQLSHDAGPRYTRAAHVESDAPKIFDWLLARPSAISELDEELAKVWQGIQGAPEFAEFEASMASIGAQLRSDPLWISLPDFSELIDSLNGIFAIASSLANTIDSSNNSNSYRRHQLATTASTAYGAVRLIESFSRFAKKRILLLTGPAGQGKTHTLVHEVNRTLDEGGIAVGVLGQTLSSSDDLPTALLRRWDRQASLQGFLDALENSAAQRNQRALIVIDALNETPNRHRWKHELAGIIGEVLNRPHLVMALSVRADYLRHVLPTPGSNEETQWVEHEHMGFSGIESDALLAYCAHYGVKAPVAPPMGELGNPLYVQLLVKSLQGRAPTSHWLPSWLDVWKAWIDRLEEDALGKIALDPSRSQPIHRTLKQLAKEMLTAGQFSLKREQAEQIAQTISGTRDIINFLCSSGALIDRIEDDEDIIEYGFERLSDTFLVDRLLDHLFAGLETTEERRVALATALSPSGALLRLASPIYCDDFLHYRRSGLLEALCLAAPIQAGVEIPELIPAGAADESGRLDDDWELRQAFTDSLRWRSKPHEFGLEPDALLEMWNERGATGDQVEKLDELIRLALIPGHPFAIEHILHPSLLGKESPGARDSAWSIYLVDLWDRDNSTLKIVLRWATEARLDRMSVDVALPAARLLAWVCAVSQQAMRKDATHGLTRLLVACPTCLPEFLPDFLVVNDAYVLEGVLLAVWGVVIDGRKPELAAEAARAVYKSMFPEGNARWCHLTIRHYARCIVEDAAKKGWLDDVDLSIVRPSYRSSLPLDLVPTEEELRRADKSGGFRSILGSALGHDFYWYVMGATSGAKPFGSRPLPLSSEPVRGFSDEQAGTRKKTGSPIFDIPLAARFVAWNCLQLGWTAERFDSFDTGYYTRGQGRIERPGRTERIGKKYQWISWQTMLGFLTDNYEMTPERRNEPKVYDTPHQISYIEVLDPSRWLQDVARTTRQVVSDSFWAVASGPAWPEPNEAGLSSWGGNIGCDLPAIDVITTVPSLPEEWGKGRWLRIAAENIWTSKFAPGQWSLNQEFHADIWWQIVPALIHAKDLPKLLREIDKPSTQERLAGIGRIDHDRDNDTPLPEWPLLQGCFDRGFEQDASYGPWLPVPWMPLVGSSGNPDESDEHGSIVVPWPRLFREWGLSMDLRQGVIRRDGKIVFGLAGWTLGEDALFAQMDILQQLLEDSGYALVWWVRGERRAFLNWGQPSEDKLSAWVDSHGVAYLAPDGRVNMAWMSRQQIYPKPKPP